MLLRFIVVFTGISHFIYGISALFDPYSISEYSRYGFSQERIAIGVFQAVFGVILIGGLRFDKLKFLGASGLSLMMVGAFATRVSIGDSIIQSVPSVIYFLLNSIIIIKSLKTLK